MAIIAPNVDPNPGPAVRIQSPESPETFGGGAGLEAVDHQVQKITDKAADIVTYEQVRADQTAVNNATSEYSKVQTDLMTNPQSGVLAAKGTNVFEVQDKAAQQLKQTADKLQEGLQGEYQKIPFQRKARDMQAQFTQTSNMHAMREIDQQQRESYQALVENETTRGALLYNDPKASNQILEDLKRSTELHAGLQGLDQQQGEKLLRGVTSNYYENTIDQMLKDNNMAPVAKYYYDTHKDDMTLKARERVEKSLNEGVLRHDSLTAAAEIKQNNPGSETAALEEAEKIPNLEQRELTKKLLSTDYQQDRAAIRNDQDATFLNVTQRVSKSGLTDPADIRLSIPPSTWNRMRPDQKDAVLKSGQTSETSPRAWNDFMQLVKDDTLKDLSKADLAVMQKDFDPATKKRSADMWANAQKGGDKKVADAYIAKSIETTLINGGDINVKSGKRSTTEAKLLKQIDGDIHDEIMQFKASSKKDPSKLEVDQMIKSRYKEWSDDHKTMVRGPWYLPDKQKPAYALTDEETGRSYIPYKKIDPTEREGIEKTIRLRNKNVTNKKVEQAYYAYRRGDRKAVAEIIDE